MILISYIGGSEAEISEWVVENVYRPRRLMLDGIGIWTRAKNSITLHSVAMITIRVPLFAIKVSDEVTWEFWKKKLSVWRPLLSFNHDNTRTNGHYWCISRSLLSSSLGDYISVITYVHIMLCEETVGKGYTFVGILTNLLKIKGRLAVMSLIYIPPSPPQQYKTGWSRIERISL